MTQAYIHPRQPNIHPNWRIHCKDPCKYLSCICYSGFVKIIYPKKDKGEIKKIIYKYMVISESGSIGNIFQNIKQDRK